MNKELDAEYQVLSEKMTHSNWVGFVSESSPDFLGSLRVICFDGTDDLFNPKGSLDVKTLTLQSVTTFRTFPYEFSSFGFDSWAAVVIIE